MAKQKSMSAGCWKGRGKVKAETRTSQYLGQDVCQRFNGAKGPCPVCGVCVMTRFWFYTTRKSMMYRLASKAYQFNSIQFINIMSLGLHAVHLYIAYTSCLVYYRQWHQVIPFQCLQIFKVHLTFFECPQIIGPILLLNCASPSHIIHFIVKTNWIYYTIDITKRHQLFRFLVCLMSFDQVCCLSPKKLK